ncbi:retrovirus-related pol polyprotein from transposon TNT 1-94 [Tanacetum coccineum]
MVYFVEGLGHNLFSIGQFCDSDLEVAFRRNTCFVRNLEEADLLKGNRTKNLYTINLHDMASTSLICLMARATSTKSWLCHQRLSYLNFDTINDLARNDLVTGLLKFKYHKEHLFPSCEQGKSKRASHPPKPVPNSKHRLHLLHIDLCGPMRIASVNGKQYVLNWRDLPRNTSLDRVEVLGMIKKRSKVRKGIVPTEMELVLEQTQQATSHEVLINTLMNLKHVMFLEKEVGEFEVLKYVMFLEKEVDEFETQKVEFSNEYDLLLQECLSNDIMCDVLRSFDDIDEQTKMQYLYLEKCQKCENLELELSKSETQQTDKRFANLEQHCIELELSLQHEMEKNVCENSWGKQPLISQNKEKALKEQNDSLIVELNQKTLEINDLKARLQDKMIANAELRESWNKMKDKVVEKNALTKPVTLHSWPQARQSVFAKPHHVNAPGLSRKSSNTVSKMSPKESVGSNDMVHNYYLEEAKKKEQLPLRPRFEF